MIEHLKELKSAGVCSLKIEGRMKSHYYVANVVNAYRRALNSLEDISAQQMEILKEELNKTSHRQYTTGFYFGSNDKECLNSSMPVQTSEFMAIVLSDSDGEKVLVEQRNRFKIGDVLEVLSPNDTFNNKIELKKMTDIKNIEITDKYKTEFNYITDDNKKPIKYFNKTNKIYFGVMDHNITDEYYIKVNGKKIYLENK